MPSAVQDIGIQQGDPEVLEVQVVSAKLTRELAAAT